jgi:hypothetical protein
MKHFSLLKKAIVVLILFCTTIAYSQITVTIGSDASKNETCVASGNYKYARSQHIYLASEVGAVGTISKLRIYVASYTGIYDGDIANFEIVLGTTTASTLSGTWASTGNIVWSGTFLKKPATGWIEFDITDFPYNGGADNLFVEFRHTDGAAFNQQPEWRYSGTSGAVRSVYGTSNTSFPPPAAAAANIRPNIQLDFTSNSVPPPPSGGTPTLDNLNVANRIKIGQSIIIDGLSNTNPSNHIYTDATTPTDLLIQSKPAPANYNTIINANNSGNVGIGTTTAPLAKLHVTNGGVLFDGPTGTTPTSGLGTRMMWIPAKAAFRAGKSEALIFGSTVSWDDANIGIGSAAFGTTNMAKGNYSFSTGTANFSMGLNTFVTGNFNGAYGDNAAAFGQMTSANSFCAFVIGRANQNLTYSADTWVPTDPLFIIGNGIDNNSPSNALTVLKNGNIGIGVTNPTLKLEVSGYISNGGSDFILGKLDTRNQGTNTSNRALVHEDFYDVYPNVIYPDMLKINYGGDFEGGVHLQGPRFIIDGQVGIGSYYVPAGYKLAVEGKIIAEELNIKLRANWPDYVFAFSYKLSPLKELEKYIIKNSHLPEMPTAKEIENNGINTSEMITKLLKQQEELTLYIIEQNKRIEALEKTATK